MQSENYKCGKCGGTISGEPIDGSARNPCPACGSTSRTIDAALREAAKATDTAELTVVTYAEYLFRTAESVLAAGHPGLAVVTAHIACELATERAISMAFQRHGIDFLAEPVEAFFNGYSLANERLRRLYSALVGDKIETQPFWQSFLESAKRRNQVIHRGVPLTPPDAEQSLNVAREFIRHVKSFM